MEILQVLGILVILLMLAYLIETFVEALLGTLLAQFPAVKPFSWMLQYVAVAVGILGAGIYNFDLIFLLARFLEKIAAVSLDIPLTTFGVILTGIGIGMGSSYLHKLFKQYFSRKPLDDLSGGAS